MLKVVFLIIARYRDRTVSVTKLSSQIYHPYRTLFTVLLILDYSNELKLTINASITTRDLWIKVVSL